MTNETLKLLSEASITNKWSDEAKLVIVCGYFSRSMDLDSEKLYTATTKWCTEAGLPKSFVVDTFCHMIDPSAFSKYIDEIAEQFTSEEDSLELTLDTPTVEVHLSKEWIQMMEHKVKESASPQSDVPLGHVFKSDVFIVGKRLLLHADIINAKPKPAIAIFLTEKGKTVMALPPVREYKDNFELSHKNTKYCLLPPE